MYGLIVTALPAKLEQRRRTVDRTAQSRRLLIEIVNKIMKEKENEENNIENRSELKS